MTYEDYSKEELIERIKQLEKKIETSDCSSIFFDFMKQQSFILTLELQVLQNGTENEFVISKFNNAFFSAFSSHTTFKVNDYFFEKFSLHESVLPEIISHALGNNKTVQMLQPISIFDKLYNINFIPAKNDKIILLLLDITEQYNISKTQENIIKLYEIIFESIANPLLLVNNENKIIVVNSKFAEYANKTKTEIEDIFYLNDIFHSDDLQNLGIDNTQNPEITINEIKIVVGKKIHYFIANSSNLLNTGYRVISLTDIGEHKQNQKDLIIFAQALKHMNECVTISDMENKIIFVNEAFTSLYGYQPEEIIGKTPSILRGTPHTSSYDVKLKDTEEWKGELYNTRKDGSEFLLSLSATIIKDDNSVPFAKIGVGSDITTIKKMQAEIDSYVMQLENSKDLLELKTMELAKLNKELSISKNELQEIVKSKDKFFSLLAHDLRSPFSALLGYLNILSDEYDELSTDEIKFFIKQAREVSDNTYELLQNLLNWSRLQTGRFEYNPKNISLFKLIKNIEKLLDGNITAKNIEVLNKFDPNIQVFADEKMLSSTIQNILSNAIKFTNNAGKIIFSASITDKLLTIEITDNGIGMSKETLSKLFKIDHITSTPGTNQEHGTGLGLLLSKEFVEKHGGQISVKSTLGKGTSFLFTIPNQQ